MQELNIVNIYSIIDIFLVENKKLKLKKNKYK